MSGLTAHPGKKIKLLLDKIRPKLYFHIGNCYLFIQTVVNVQEWSFTKRFFFGKSSLSVTSKIMASLICLLEQDKKCVANIYEICDNDMPRIS